MNHSVHVLDCTLRDGGYVNDWRFGDEVAKDIVDLTCKSGVEYSELGFIRNCDYEKNKIEFNKMSQIAELFRPSCKKLAVMVEIGYGYPVSAFPARSAETVELVRLIVWKNLIQEGIIYAQELKRRGYEVAIQATRTDQYTLEEFADFVKAFSEMSPKAIYIVDTFGLFAKEKLLDYAAVTDASLYPQAYLGYHAHNNMQQAVSNMMAVCEHPWKHELMLDASVMGIGRGAGNLCLELLEKYLNERFGTKYELGYVYECADKYIQPIYEESPWGYSIPYLLSAINGCNPSYVQYLKKAGMSMVQMDKIFRMMRKAGEGIKFDPQQCENMMLKVKSDR